MEKFFKPGMKPDRSGMDLRIAATCESLGWRETIHYLLAKNIPFNKLQVAEVGCGSGTFSLTLGLLGAQVTLIDVDDDALAYAKKAFGLFEVEASFVNSDILGPIPRELEGRFDLAASGGLAEHFTGEDRGRCFVFHRALLRKGGFALIGVPNTLSPCYQTVRWFRTLTGTWGRDLEQTYSYRELRTLAKLAGFSSFRTFGNHSVRKDLYDYSRGLLAAILLLFPKPLQDRIRSRKRLYGSARKIDPSEPGATARTRVEATVEKLRAAAWSPEATRVKDYVSAGLMLFGWMA